MPANSFEVEHWDIQELQQVARRLLGSLGEDDVPPLKLRGALFLILAVTDFPTPSTITAEQLRSIIEPTSLFMAERVAMAVEFEKGKGHTSHGES
jgi:hypothetical protein